MAAVTKTAVPARIVVVAPPPGVAYALQRGRSEIVGSATSSGADLQFDFVLLVARGPDEAPRLSGEFVQGPSGGKFIYVTIGTRAGQPASPWDRRAKVPLHNVTWPLVEEVLQDPGHVVQARFAGTGRDGSPACATVPLLEGWMATRLTKA